MKQTTVGDLIAALSKYPVDTPIVGGTFIGVSSVFSIQEARGSTGSWEDNADTDLLNVSLHVWPATVVEADTIIEEVLILGKVTPVLEPLPRLVPLDPIPANANPFNHDLYHMGVGVTGPWMAMYSGHYGPKPEASRTTEERSRLETVWYDDPKYIILINQRTGQRFKMIWDQVPKEDFSEVMQAMMRQRELQETQNGGVK